MEIQDFVKIYDYDLESFVVEYIREKDTIRGDWTDAYGNHTGYQNMDVVACENEDVYAAVSQYAKTIAMQYGHDFKFPINAGSSPRFNRYKEGDLMESHIDHIHSCFDGQFKGIPVISIVAGLNSDYDGGEFIFNFSDSEKVFRINKGKALVFPSAFPWMHEVKPVTKGVRYTWVSWVW